MQSARRVLVGGTTTVVCRVRNCEAAATAVEGRRTEASSLSAIYLFKIHTIYYATRESLQQVRGTNCLRPREFIVIGAEDACLFFLLGQPTNTLCR